MAREVFTQAGFAGELLDVALGVSWAESEGYSDAVGDITLISEKWGPSIGLFQIRSLRHPEQFAGIPDELRVAEELRDPHYNAAAALALVTWRSWDLWTVYRTGAYLPHVGKDYQIRTGHPRADQWEA